MIFFPWFSLGRKSPEWCALDNDEIPVGEIAEAHIADVYQNFIEGDSIFLHDGRLYGVTRSGNRQTARAVLAREKTPMEKFPA